MHKVLFIARAFPPFFPVGFSIRAVKFIKYLPALNWLPYVLTIDDRKEYENTRRLGSETLLSEIQRQVKILRTHAGEPSSKYLEKEELFSQKNRLAKAIIRIIGGARRWIFRKAFLPDRYISWLPFALLRGRKIVRDERIDVILVTCPPHSASIIGAMLAIITGKPLIVDFRDDWIDTPWHRSKSALSRRIDRSLERWVVGRASKVILVTEWSRKAFVARYPKFTSKKFILIPNGCDLGEFDFIKSADAAQGNSKFTILHAGAVNISQAWGRNPTGLFRAIQELLRQKPELRDRIQFVFAGDLPAANRRMALEMGIDCVIKWLGHLPHTDVLRLIESADLLLAINYDGFSTIIPAKIYEYWAAGAAPVLLLSCLGAASDFVKEHELGRSIDPMDVRGIKDALEMYFSLWLAGKRPSINPAGIEAYDREHLTVQLAHLLSEAIAP